MQIELKIKIVIARLKDMGAGVGDLYIFASVATYILTHCFDICFNVLDDFFQPETPLSLIFSVLSLLTFDFGQDVDFIMTRL